ncbi:SPOSA6832_01159, partial [Sporobolomyces salmonicolor]
MTDYAASPPSPDARASTLRHRTVVTSNPASSAMDVTPSSASTPLTPSLPPSPALRPTLSHSSTDSGSSSSSPRFDLTEDDPLFSVLSLLDLFNVVDAHWDLWTRPLRRKSVSWISKADKLLDDAKQKSREFKEFKVPTFELGRSMTADGFGGNQREPAVLSQKDKERLERKYKEMRARMRENVSKLMVKWEEEYELVDKTLADGHLWLSRKTVRLRDKISFLCGVMNVLISALLLGFEPTWIPAWYTGQMLVYTPYRVYTYKRKAYHYFLFDLCYFVNVLTLLYLWVFPGSTILFEACYGLTLGSLGTYVSSARSVSAAFSSTLHGCSKPTTLTLGQTTRRAIATWRNSLVFHSLDKVISLAIHIFPPFVFTVIRHYYPQEEALKRYPAMAKLPHLNPWRSMAISMTVYTVWQLLYYYFVVQLRAEKIKEGRATSFTFMVNDKKRLIGKIAAKVPRQWRETVFMAGQAIYTFVTLLLPLFVLYDSKLWSDVYLLVLFAVSVWNGASFYMEVFSRRFEKELIALRKEFEAQQALLARYSSTNPPSHTPGAGLVTPDPFLSSSNGNLNGSSSTAVDSAPAKPTEVRFSNNVQVNRDPVDAEEEGEDSEVKESTKEAADEGLGEVTKPV